LIKDNNGHIYAGTDDGIWRRDISDIFSSNEENSDILKQFSISQNYPNPFNPSTSIQYAIPIRQYVTLKIYDVLGTEIETLVNEEKPAGSYEVEFDGSNLGSGIYFCELRVGENLSIKKMLLLK
jgi:hypothetical protein